MDGSKVMYMAYIGGWDPVMAFSVDEKKAKTLALVYKKQRCADDLDKWNWKECEEYYGAWVETIEEGTVIEE